MLRWLALCAAVALLAAPTAFAQGSTRDRILAECEQGELRGSYTARQLRDARNHIPADLRTYTDCEEILDRVLTGLGGGGSSRGGDTAEPGGSGGGAPPADGAGGGAPPADGTGGGTPPATAVSPEPTREPQPGRPRSSRRSPVLTPNTPEEQEALAQSEADPGAPVTLGENDIDPGAVGLTVSAIRQDVPTPVLAVLVALGLAALAALALPVRRLVRRRRGAAPS